MPPEILSNTAEEKDWSEIPYCPEGHMNPYAWMDACDACAQISIKEKQHLEKMALLAKQRFSEEEQGLIASLRTNGLDDPRTQQLLLHWRKEEEAKVKTSREGIDLDLEEANLYWTAGFPEGALESLDAARIVTLHEGSMVQ
jgi:hypothetical protein